MSSRAAHESPFPLTDVDRFNLTQTDEQFTKLTWQDLKEIIASNKLELLRRTPSDLKRYIKWSSETKAEYGSVPMYVMKKRLHWTPSPATTAESGPLFAHENPIPFASPRDYKILPNDWPYGVESGIVHLIVWLRNRLEVEPTMGDLTPKSREQIENFIQTHIIDRVRDLPGPVDKVMWFKNWAALQSVPGVDHVHIFVRNVPASIVDEWTSGERIVQ